MELHFTRHARDMMARRSVKREWIERACAAPERTESDSLDDSLVHYLKRIPENGDRVLRVVINGGVKPNSVVTVFFDRGMKGKL